jgi:hypothetical protein
VSDSAGNAAYLQFVTVINGPADAIGATKGSGLGSIGGDLLAAWPLVGLACVMTLFFWLGERRELRKLRRRHMLA